MQRCAVDVVNHMVKDCSSQSKTDSWAFAVFTFLIDVAVINAQTILRHNLKKPKINRRAFLNSLIFQLVLPWIKKRYSIAGALKMRCETKSAVISILRRYDPSFKEEERAIPPADKGKCYKCLVELDSLKGKEKTKKRNKMGPISYNCSKCGHPACTNHRAKLPVSLEPVCDNCLNRYAQMM